MEADFRRDHHYVPRLYLKQWEDAERKVYAYRTLVSHENVPHWKYVSSRSIAKLQDLYVNSLDGEESDDFEYWILDNVENPADKVIQKAVSDERLSREDWGKLIRFLVAQDIRTPFKYEESIERWNNTLPDVMESVVRDFGDSLKKKKRVPKNKQGNLSLINFPSKITREASSLEGVTNLGIELLAGRSLWIWHMRRVLEHSWVKLKQLHWAILKPPTGITFLTSDNPVVRLNYYNDNNYNFNGGWLQYGTDILMPLSPNHLLCTAVGKRLAHIGGVMSEEAALLVQRIVAEHSDRFVFADRPSSEVLTWRPRLESQADFDHDKNIWAKWNQDQMDAESSFRNSTSVES